ncbi:MAG: hypothetical protein HYU28_04060 [Actinobacteria bacterium]|nr:hypothetical protein [Actinomycetota bacterium]
MAQPRWSTGWGRTLVCVVGVIAVVVVGFVVFGGGFFFVALVALDNQNDISDTEMLIVLTTLGIAVLTGVAFGIYGVLRWTVLGPKYASRRPPPAPNPAVEPIRANRPLRAPGH